MEVNTTVSGGDQLARKLEEMKAKFATNNQVLVGVPAASGAYSDGSKIVDIAAANEFGTQRIPERSFLRVPLRANYDLFRQAFTQLMPQVSEGKLTMAQALNQIGSKAASVSQEAISSGIAPANADSTIERKGSTKPLIDTGRLRQSITWIVVGGGE